MKRSALLDTFLLLCLAAVLIWPLFRLEYLDQWPSIESTFISDARMLADHLPHPGWQPLWYCGTRFDYIYPPALRYGTALILKAEQASNAWISRPRHVSAARAYHLYTAILYIFGIAAVYWLVLAGSASRGAALLASIASALLSPSFLLLAQYRRDSPFLVPQRLHVLMLYGEGPHISALSILPAALAASYLALRSRRPAIFALAAGLCAFDVANNFYGAQVLAMIFPILVWAVWIGERSLGERSGMVWLRAAGIAMLAYGLNAFWLTPSFIRITLINLRWVALPGNTWSRIVAVLVVALFCAVSLAVASRRPDRAWTVFVAGFALVFGVDVLGLFYFGFRVTGDAGRLVPELDLALILVCVELMRAFWKHPKGRILAAILTVAAFYPAVGYLSHAWFPFPKAKPLDEVYEYRMARWVHENLPGGRVLPAGSIRFWFDAWFDNAQPDGGSAQGILNQVIPNASWQITRGDQASPAVLWLQALGTDAVIVPDATALEPYHDYTSPHKFIGALPVLYDDHAGTVIYRVPRIHPSIGRVVDNQAIAAAASSHVDDDLAPLTKYVAAVETADQPLTPVTWNGTDQVDVQATVAAGQSVLLQETYDPYWHAEENGTRIGIRPDPFVGFMLMDVPPGAHRIHMRFEVPMENRVGQIVFGISLVVVAGLVFGRRRAIVA
jgi:hypothetical protein